MAEIRPFRGIRYDQGVVGDLSQVICPPYDIITDEQQRIYQDRSGYNAILLERPLPVVEESGLEHHEGYGRAAAVFQQWLSEGVLRVDDCPAFYLHDHYFAYQGRRTKRRELIACVRLRPWYDGIYPHEETTLKAKHDRLELVRACRASFSPIFALYQDSEAEVAEVLCEASGDGPVVEFGDSHGGHVVWAITEPELIRRIRELMVSRSLYVADGHHRYETALLYQQEQGSLYPELAHTSEQGAFNYAMMTLADFSDEGLVVLPVCRLVRGVSESAMVGLESRLRDYFALECVSLGESPGQGLGGEVLNGALIGVLGLSPHCLLLLKPREDVSTENMMPRDRSQAYRCFSVSLLNHLLLDRTLGIPYNSDNIAYSADVNEVYRQVSEGRYQLAFLPSPPQMEMVRAVADAKDRMPRKSTYFCPKAPAGLIISSLDWL